jgi:hypothetical protein
LGDDEWKEIGAGRTKGGMAARNSLVARLQVAMPSLVYKRFVILRVGGVSVIVKGSDVRG